MKTKKYFVLLGMLAALLLIVTPGLVMAGGGGGASPEKPGGSCETAGDYKYLPPPYTGMVTVIYQPTNESTGDLYLSGTVEKVGQSTCDIDIQIPHRFKVDVGYDADVFIGFKPGDLGGECVEGIQGFYSCPHVGFTQIVGAGKAVLTTVDCPTTEDTCPALTFHAVVMDLVDLNY